MNKTLIIYSSKYGHTKRYAQWLAEVVQADICESKSLNTEKLKGYETIAFGSSIYAGRNKGAVALAKHFEQIKDKKIVLFTVGIYNPDSESNIAKINEDLNKVLTPEIRDKINIFHLRSGIDSPNLSVPHKIMLKFVHSILAKKAENELSDADKDILSVYGKTVDFSDKKMLEPIVEWIQK